MGFAQQLEKLSSQPMEEQNLLVKSYNNLKDFIYEKKIEKFYKQVDLSGPKVLRNSPYANDKGVVLKVIEMEHQFRLDRQKLSFADPDHGIEMTPQEEQLEKMNQPAQERISTSKTYSLQDYLEEKKLESFMAKVNEIGPVALKNSPYADNKEVVIAVMKNENQYVQDDYAQYDAAEYPNSFGLNDEQRTRIASYGRDRKPDSRGATSVMQFVSERLRDDVEVGRAATLNIDGHETKYLSTRLLDNEAIALNSLTSWDGHYPVSLSVFSDRLKDDKEFIIKALKECECGDDLRYASPRLRDDLEVAIGSIHDDPSRDGIPWVSERLKDSTELAIKVAEKDSEKLSAMSERIQQIAQGGKPVPALKNALEAEKRAQSLEQKLAPKAETQTRKLKI